MSNYTIAPNDGFGDPRKWSVWHAITVTRLSEHDTERQAKAAVKRYETADAKRARQADHAFEPGAHGVCRRCGQERH